MGDYTCPPYCKVDHKHIKEKENDWNNGYTNAEGKEEEYLYGIKRYDKYPISERKERASLH